MIKLENAVPYHLHFENRGSKTVIFHAFHKEMSLHEESIDDIKQFL
jgi:hypothetical protein